MTIVTILFLLGLFFLALDAWNPGAAYTPDTACRADDVQHTYEIELAHWHRRATLRRYRRRTVTTVLNPTDHPTQA